MKYRLTKKRKLIIYKNVLSKIEHDIDSTMLFMCNLINNEMFKLTNITYHISNNSTKWKEFYKHIPNKMSYNSVVFKIVIKNPNNNESNVWFNINKAGNLKRVKVIKSIIKELETN